jgi:hypothetical protein
MQRTEPQPSPPRLYGADRSGLGDKGWAEVPEDGVGHPDDSNVDPAWFTPIETPERRS